MAEQFRLEQIRKEQEEEREVGYNFQKKKKFKNWVHFHCIQY